MSSPQVKSRRNVKTDAGTSGEDTVGGEIGASAASLQRELNRLKAERDSAIQQGREWQLQVAKLKADLDKERGSYDRIVSSKSQNREKEIRDEVMSEWAKSEAGWKERVRNERLLRLSYERVLTNLGFAPHRIASDIVRLSNPQPSAYDESNNNSPNLLELEAGLNAQPLSTKRGIFAMSMSEILEKGNSHNKRLGTIGPQRLEQSNDDEFFTVVTDSYNSRGRRDLLKTLSMV